MKYFISSLVLITFVSISVSSQERRSTSTGSGKMLGLIAAADGNSASLADANSAERPEQSANQLKETLINLEKQSWEAWKKRDGKFFEGFLSNDHVELGSNGPATKAQIVPFVASPICVVKSYSVDRFAMTAFDANTAVLTYHAEQDTTCNGVAVPSPVWVSSLYVRRGGHWLNALYQQSQASGK